MVGNGHRKSKLSFSLDSIGKLEEKRIHLELMEKILCMRKEAHNGLMVAGNA